MGRPAPALTDLQMARVVEALAADKPGVLALLRRIQDAPPRSAVELTTDDAPTVAEAVLLGLLVPLDTPPSKMVEVWEQGDAHDLTRAYDLTPEAERVLDLAGTVDRTPEVVPPPVEEGRMLLTPKGEAHLEHKGLPDAAMVQSMAARLALHAGEKGEVEMSFRFNRDGRVTARGRAAGRAWTTAACDLVTEALDELRAMVPAPG